MEDMDIIIFLDEPLITSDGIGKQTACSKVRN